MSSSKNLKTQQFPKIGRDNIPAVLKDIDQWVNWRAGPAKPNGKFDKIPVDPSTGRSVNGLAPQNWRSFDEALAAYDRGIVDGIGFVLSPDRPIVVDGKNYYIVALDFDNCLGSLGDFKSLWVRLGKTYVERSPSGNGLRMFALSEVPLKGGNDGHGRELYSGGRFMTVTGWEGHKDIKDATAALGDLQQQWFGTSALTHEPGLVSNLRTLPDEESVENIERVQEMLAFVSSDTDYETWRNIVWSILSTGWTCAERIAREWSEKAVGRYDAAAFGNLVSGFDVNGGITLGTLFHHAEKNGWTKPEAPQPKVAESTVAHRLLTAEEVKALPNLPYRVRGLLPAQGVAAIYGEPGSGKSFLAMDLCFSIADGTAAWFGMAVKPAPVAYVALEGRGGVSKRIKAWERHNNRDVSKQVRFLLDDFTILDPKGVEKLAVDILTALGLRAVVVVDTLNQSAPGADENASKDMGLILSNAQKLAKRVEGLVVLIHHAGKDSTRGMRGHSSLLAAMDAVIEVTKSAAGRSWRVAKAKDDEGGIGSDFELVRYLVDVDQDGFDVTSCAVSRTVNASVAKAKPLAGKRQIAAMTRLRVVLSANPSGISLTDATIEVAAALSCAPSRRTNAAKETIKRLSDNGHLVLNNEIVRLP